MKRPYEAPRIVGSLPLWVAVRSCLLSEQDGMGDHMVFRVLEGMCYEHPEGVVK